MNKILTIACVILSHSISLAEVTASHTAAVEKLLVAMETEQQMKDTLVAGLEAGLGANAAQLKALPQEQQDKFAASKKKMMDFLAVEMSWEKIKPDLISVYSKTYTEKEVTELTTFMLTPTGKLFTSKQSMISIEIMKTTQARMATLMPKFMAIIQEGMK